MSLLFIDGFDAYGTANTDITSPLEENGYVITFAVDSATPMALSDNGTGVGMSCNVTSFHGGDFGQITRYFPIQSGIVAGFRVKINTGKFGHICVIGYNNLLGSINNQIMVASNGANGITVTDGNGNFIVASANNVFFQATWQYMEILYVPDPASGTIEIKIDGVAVINYGSQKTTTGAMPGSINFFGFLSDGADYGLYVDDFYLESTSGSNFNTFLGDVVVHDLLPASDAGANQFTKVGGGTGHYTAVDDTPPDGDTSYLQSNTVGQKEIFTLPTFPVDIVDVLAMGVNIIARKSNAGTATYNALMVTGGVEGDGPAIAPSTAYISSQTLYAAPPGGGNWTLTSAQDSTFGVEIAS